LVPFAQGEICTDEQDESTALEMPVLALGALHVAAPPTPGETDGHPALSFARIAAREHGATDPWYEDGVPTASFMTYANTTCKGGRVDDQSLTDT
jgi:hypothetical protein